MGSQADEKLKELTDHLMDSLVDWDAETWNPNARMFLEESLRAYADFKVQEALNKRSSYREDCGCCDGCEQGFGCEYPTEGC